MRKLWISCVIVVLIIGGLNAQEIKKKTKYWKIDGNTSLNFSQVSLSNWSEGGEGSVAGTFMLKINANKKKGKHIWDNTLDFEYGRVKNDSEGSKKSIDKLNIASKYGYDIGKNWYFAVLGDFRTQVDKGYNYPNKDVYISEFLAPAYLNMAVGFDYKPKECLSIFMSPIDMKSTIVMDDFLSDAGSFGVDPGDKYKAEFGAYVKVVVNKKNIITNVDFESTLDLFSSYTEDPQYVDMNWDLRFIMKINKYLSANAGATFRYDNDIKSVDDEGNIGGPKIQIKQFLGVGISYKF